MFTSTQLDGGVQSTACSAGGFCMFTSTQLGGGVQSTACSAGGFCMFTSTHLGSGVRKRIFHQHNAAPRVHGIQ